MANGVSMQVTINKAAIANQLYNSIKNTDGKIKDASLQYFVLQTEGQVKNDSNFQLIKNQVRQMRQRLNAHTLENCFEAYQLLMDVRKFFLGEKGEINYKILWSTRGGGNAQIWQATIGHKMFRQLILNNGEVKNLQFSGNNIRFKSGFKTSLKNTLNKSLQGELNQLKKKGVNIEIRNNQFELTLTSLQNGEKTISFKNPNVFKSLIQSQQQMRKSVNGRYYAFEMSAKLSESSSGKASLSYIITKISGQPQSSSIFSAIGKYAGDELIAKQEAAAAIGQSSISRLNTGNLSQAYVLAKKRFNSGKNDLDPRRSFSGQTMFSLFNQIRSNTDPFYMGGDILEEQIKSFLGSMPSLTDINTLKKSLEDFDKAFNKDSKEQIRKALSDLLIKKDSLDEDEKKLAQALSEQLVSSLNQIFGM